MASKMNITITVLYIIGCAVFLAIVAYLVPADLLSPPVYISLGSTSTLFGAYKLFKILKRRDAKGRAAESSPANEETFSK